VTKKKTAWEKIEPLIKLNPNNAYVRTALRHFDDEALRRELQRRNATGNDGASRMAQVDDELFVAGDCGQGAVEAFNQRTGSRDRFQKLGRRERRFRPAQIRRLFWLTRKEELDTTQDADEKENTSRASREG